MRIKSGKEAIKNLVESTKEAINLSSQIEISGNKNAVIQGTVGILEYNEDSVRIKLLEREITFYGAKLKIECLSQDSIELKGAFTRIDFL